jgi:glucose/arabinose dehydrogenase
MKLGVVLLALIVLSSAASAQTPKTPQTPTTQNQSAATAAGVAARLQAQGYSEIQNLHRGPDGKWVGQATRNGVPVTITAGQDGGITAR